VVAKSIYEWFSEKDNLKFLDKLESKRNIKWGNYSLSNDTNVVDGKLVNGGKKSKRKRHRRKSKQRKSKKRKLTRKYF
jgi:NAD-dependent DNA ligase